MMMYTLFGESSSGERSLLFHGERDHKRIAVMRRNALMTGWYRSVLTIMRDDGVLISKTRAKMNNSDCVEVRNV
jgi:hypothetical protein